MNDTENENKTASQTDLKAVTQAYLEAFDARDLERCLGFFSDDATIDFNKTVYNGLEAVTDWHKDRFAADLRLVRLNNISVNGDTVVVDAVAASKRLAAWKVKSISGRITMRFVDGKIKSGKLAARMSNPINMMREDMGA